MRRGFQPPADLWGSVGILVAAILVARMSIDLLVKFGKVCRCVGRVYEIVGFRQLLLVKPALQIMGMFDGFYNIENPGLFLFNP